MHIPVHIFSVDKEKSAVYCFCILADDIDECYSVSDMVRPPIHMEN